MKKPTITHKITVQIKDQEIELSKEEAEALLNALSDALGQKYLRPAFPGQQILGPRQIGPSPFERQTPPEPYPYKITC